MSDSDLEFCTCGHTLTKHKVGQHMSTAGCLEHLEDFSSSKIFCPCKEYVPQPSVLPIPPLPALPSLKLAYDMLKYVEQEAEKKSGAIPQTATGSVLGQQQSAGIFHYKATAKEWLHTEIGLADIVLGGKPLWHLLVRYAQEVVLPQIMREQQEFITALATEVSKFPIPVPMLVDAEIGRKFREGQTEAVSSNVESDNDNTGKL